MANDATTQIPQSDADMSGDAHEMDFAATQVAETTEPANAPTPNAAIVDGKTVHVQIPQGGSVVRVPPVSAGETVILPPPFDSAHDIAAKEGNGNLAVKVGDVTVILQGYIDAANDPQNPVTLEGSDHKPIDIAVVLASTDPNLDIQTAAGPAVGAQGAENGHFLAAFGGAGGLGGFNAVGVLDQTELNYKLIDNNIRQEIKLQNNAAGPLDIVAHWPNQALLQAFLHDPAITQSQIGSNLNYTWFQTNFANGWADFDGTQATPGVNDGVHQVGSISVDPHNATSVDVNLTTTGLEAQHLTSGGVELTYVVSQDGTTIFGFRGDGTTGDGALVLVVHVDDNGTPGTGTEQTFNVDYYLVNRLDDTTGTGDATTLDVSFDVTTGDDRSASGTTTEIVNDDAPIAHNDTDTVDNATNTATGNVITGVNTTSGAAGKDLPGADGAKVSDLVGFKGSADHDASDGLTVKGEHGTLTMNANGGYTYTRDDGSPANFSETFTYTITDGDGDTATATLIVGVNDKNPEVHVPTDAGSTTVDEKGLPPHAGLPAGSGEISDGNPNNNSDKSEIVSGKIAYTEGDAPATITIADKDGNLVNVAAGADIVGKDGTLHINSVGGGNIDYTYTLTTNTSGDATHDDFAVEVKDADGDKADGTLVINIHDDVPTALDDTDSVDNATDTATGNVITGANTTSGDAGKDVLGADGAQVTGLSGATTDNDAKGDFVVQGDHGTLTMKADGEYTYVRDAGSPDTYTETFTYTLTDGDGDTTTAHLTLGVNDKLPTVHVPTDAGSTTVDEMGLPPHGGLPAGSGEIADGNPNNNSDKSETTNGTITYTEGDAPATITITDKDGKAVAVTAGADITGADGTLHINSVGGGKIDYTYTLTTNTSGDTTHDDFKVTVKDVDGDTANGTLVINIVDDVPTAHNDSVSVGNQHGYTSGLNVEANDVFGADGAATGGGVVGVAAGVTGADATTGADSDIHGQFGTLHLKADGTFTYTRDSDAPTDDPSTPQDESQTDTFTYTIKDGDGDLSHAVLTVNIDDHAVTVTPPPPPPPGGGGNPIDLNSNGTAVFESALSTGSDPASTLETTKGHVTIEAKDGVGTIEISINGTTASVDLNNPTATSVTGTYGDLKVTGWNAATGELDYSYTLTKNDPNHTTQGNDIISKGEDFTVTATDTDGDKSQGDIVIAIVDDVPTAKDDTDSVDNATDTATGNVITGVDTTSGNAGKDVLSADAPTTVVGLSGVTTDNDAKGDFVVQGDHGTLTMKADGSYTYVRDAGSPGGYTEQFTYTIKDADGDTSSAHLTIGANDKVPTVHVPTDAGSTTVDEKGLPPHGGLPAGSGETADGNPNNNSDKSETVTGTVTYTEGDAPATLTITDKDGKAVAVTAGADIVGKDGTLHIDSVGGGNIGYTYTLTTNTSGDATHDDFKVTVKDVDGDTADGTLVINIHDDVPTAHNDTDTVSNATNTADGNVITGVNTTSTPGGIDVLGADGAKVSDLTGLAGSATPTDHDASNGLTVTGQYGTLVMGTDGGYTYTRFDGTPLTATDTFTYTLTDGDGDKSTANLVVSIDDHGTTITNLTPQADGGDVKVYEDDLLASRGPGEAAGSDPTKESTTQGGDFSISAPDGVQTVTVDGHAVITNGAFAATSWTTGDGNTLSITNYDATTGKISYTYTLNDNENHPTGNGNNSLFENFEVKVTDKDGDSATGTLTANIIDDVPTANSGNKSMELTGNHFNVLLTIDLSNSMNDSSGVAKQGGGTFTKLELEKAAIVSMLQAYQAQGQTAVHVNWFNDPGSGSGAGVGSNTGWVSVADAIAYVNGLNATGSTNYDVAIDRAEQSFSQDNLTGYIANGTTVSYFLSDGMPNANNGPGSDGVNGISGAQQTAWETFLDLNNINSYAIGVGGAAVGSALTPIAYNGNVAPGGDPNPAGNTIVITDLNQLSSTINSTVQPPVMTTGNLLGDTGSLTGADGAHINTVTINGTTHSYADNATHTATFDLGQGTLVVNMTTGEYTYTPKAGAAQSQVDITFNLIDGDGDVSGNGTLHLVPVNHAPAIDSDGGGDSATVSLVSGATLVTHVHVVDHDAAATVSFAITGGADKSLFTIDSKTGALSFVTAPDAANPQDAGHDNTYNVVVTATDDKAATDTQAIAVTVHSANDVVYTTQTDSATVQDSWLTANDHSGAGGQIVSIIGQSDLNASHSLSNQTVTLSSLFGSTNDANEHATLDYKFTDTNGSVNAHVDVYYQATSMIDHHTDTANSIVIGSSANETIKTGSGDDVIVTGGGTDTVDGGAGFDQVVLSGTASFKNMTNIEMVNLGDNDHSPNNSVTISAADVLQGANVANLGGKDVDLFVIGDANGSGKDTVNLTGFSGSAVASNVSFIDPASHSAHAFDLYQGTGANSGVIVAVEHDLTVKVS